MLQDMTAELQEDLITEQNPNCFKEDQSQSCSNCKMSSYKVEIIRAQTVSRS